MVSRSYMTGKPTQTMPDGLRRLVHEGIVPMLADAAGGLEGAAWRAGERVRDRPVASMLAAAGLGYLVSLLFRTLARRA